MRNKNVYVQNEFTIEECAQQKIVQLKSVRNKSRWARLTPEAVFNKTVLLFKQQCVVK